MVYEHLESSRWMQGEPSAHILCLHDAIHEPLSNIGAGSSLYHREMCTQLFTCSPMEQ